MYVTVCSVDVRGGDHWMYALQAVQADIRGTTGHMLLFEYILVNTWMFKAVFGPLGKNHQTYAPLVGHPLLSGPINTPYPFMFCISYRRPQTARVFPKCFESV
jgi:hypothetical protein